MKALLLAGLLGVLHAEVVVKHLTLQEGGAEYTQTVTLDFERNIQILEVPAHNNIVHSKTIFDFNQGVLFESHPEASTCYMKDIPEGVVSMQKFAAFLDRKTEPVAAEKEVTKRRAYKTTTMVTPHQLSSMAQEVVAECGNSNVFQVEPVAEQDFDISYRRAPKSLAEVFSMGCNMADSCLWQTCQVGSDSCWWTVNCDVSETDCDETLEHSSVIHECANGGHGDCQISCRPCYNMQCPGCAAAWEGCRPTFDSSGVGQCPEDPELGKNCGRIYCPMHADVPGGAWECPGAGDKPAKVEEGQTCVLWCPDHQFGGMITCTHEASWDESSLVGCH